MLVGETANQYPVYMPFDDVDASINLGDAQAFTQFASRAAAAGGIVTLGPQFAEFAELIGAHVGPVAKVAWPNATTYLGRHPGIDRVVLRHNVISTPRHRQAADPADFPARGEPLPGGFAEIGGAIRYGAGLTNFQRKGFGHPSRSWRGCAMCKRTSAAASAAQ